MGFDKPERLTEQYWDKTTVTAGRQRPSDATAYSPCPAGRAYTFPTFSVTSFSAATIAPCVLLRTGLSVLFAFPKKELAEQFDCAVHAHVLMTNHVHFLLTPH